MKDLFDKVSLKSSKMVTNAYSTSFSLGIKFLSNRFHDPIYSVYGFVRFADEIVDSFHDFNKKELLADFRKQTYAAIEQKISLNPILNSFQNAVNQYKIPIELIDTFLDSMEMDLENIEYDRSAYEKYILGSAEVVGLMCLKVFLEGDEETYLKLKPEAMALGSAFQKINFLRDLNADYDKLGRTYFPGVDLKEFNDETKRQIEEEIEEDFYQGYLGIKKLPKSARFGVYVAYVYYYSLFSKIKSTPSSAILQQRIRIPNNQKFALLFKSYIKHSFNIL
jgi:phytoene/squalene synthetase